MTSIDSHSSTTSLSKGACRCFLFAGACAALATFAGPPDASAQMVGFMPDVFVDIDEAEPRLPPRSVLRRLQNRGFAEIGRPRYDGQAYIVEATHPSGSRVRLFVDAYDGALLGRRVIGEAYPPQARVARAVPGYGWTEDDALLRRPSRAFGGPMPPAEIPMPSGRAQRRDAPLGAESLAPEAGPHGLNPEGKARPGSAARKSARLTQPQKLTAPQVAPPAPEAKLDSPQGAKIPAESRPIETKQIETKPAEAKRDAENDGSRAQDTDNAAGRANPEPAKADVASPNPATPAQAATNGARSSETPGASDAPTTGAAGPAPVTPAANKPETAATDASEAPREQAWKDIEPSKKNVRVIDGATVVPGSEPAPSRTN